MIKKTYCLLICLLLLLSTVLYSQSNNDNQKPFTSDSTIEYKDINVPNDIRKTLEFVFPGVKFQYVQHLLSTDYGEGILQAVFNNKGYRMPEKFNSLISDLNNEIGHIQEINDETLIKAFVFLTLMDGPKPFLKNNFKNIKISHEISRYPKTNHKGLSDELTNFNYRIRIDLDVTTNGFHWKYAELFILVHDKKILSGYGFIESNTGKKLELDLWKSEVNCKIHLKQNNKSVNEKADQKNSEKENTVTGYDVALYQYSNYVFPFPQRPNGDYYLYMQTGKNGTPTSAQTKFRISGLNPSNNNLNLRIYTCYEFVDRTLLWSDHIIDIQPDGTGVTQDVFIPNNDDKDGFCVFEIWDGNTFLTQVTNTFLVLEKYITGSFSSGMDYKIHFAYRNFWNRPPIISTANDYLIKTEQYLNESWNKEINQWHLCQGLPNNIPSNSNPYYDLSINPIQTPPHKQYIYYYNDDQQSCYSTRTTYRHVGISGDVKLWNHEMDYTENEQIEAILGHEFFHGIQSSFHPTLASSQLNWLIEGQARFIQTVINESAEFTSDPNHKTDYKNNANFYILNNLKTSLEQIAYPYCLFWRYLYENYNGTSTSVSDKLEIIRSTCSGYTTPDIPTVESFMNQKLATTYSATLYPSMDDAIKDFAKRVYFNNTNGFWTPMYSGYYTAPHQYEIDYNGIAKSISPSSIPSSFGFEYTHVVFNSTGDVYVTFDGNLNNSNNIPDYYVNVVFLNDVSHNNIITLSSGSGENKFHISSSGSEAVVIVARLDNQEASKMQNRYKITVQPSIPPDVLKSDFIKGNKKSTNSLGINEPISFLDQSHQPDNHPITSWHWTFNGANIQYSDIQNPSGIEYAFPGEYTVTLTVTNDNDEDTQTKVNYILIYDPGSGGGNVEFSVDGPWSGSVGELLTFNVNIYEGSPPFNISYDFGDQYIVHQIGINSLYTNVSHSYLQSGQFTMHCQVTDAASYSSSETEQISIGNPGSQTAGFSYTPSTSIGTYMGVSFHDQTIGGYKPYLEWEWIYGNEVYTNAQPVNSSGDPWPWETIWNIDHQNVSGDPLNAVYFPQYGVYPVTLIVTDYQGFSQYITQYIQVTQQSKCLNIYDFYLTPYAKTPYWKHDPRKIRLTVPHVSTLFFYAGNSQYYNQSNLTTCTDSYGLNSGSNPLPVITNTRFKFLTNSNNVLSQQSLQMPFDWRPPDYYFNDWFETQIITREFYTDLTQKGKYKVSYEVWNNREYPDEYQFPGTLNPQNQGNFPMYSAIEVPYYVVDCNEIININQDIVAGVYETEFAGNFNFANLAITKIKSGAKIAYESCDASFLFPGFTVEYGSDFRVTSDPIDLHYKKDNNNINGTSNSFFSSGEISDYILYPNPSEGIFNIKGTSLKTKINDVKIMSSLGVVLQPLVSFQDNNATITLNENPSNYLLVKISNNIGEVFYKKIVVIHQ